MSPFFATGADINGDGYLDVIGVDSGSAGSGGDSIYWYMNDGNQNFTGPIEIDALTSDGRSVTTVDLDGDGDIDVLSASGDTSRITWYENNGEPNTPTFAKHTISTDGTRGRWITTSDIDNDGDIDVFSADVQANTITWHENDGNENFTNHKVTENANAARAITIADVNSDGNFDIVAVYDETIAWFENNSDGTFAEMFIDNIGRSFGVTATDIDNDGDTDLLSAGTASDTLTLHVNDGQGNFFPRIIDNSSSNANDVFSVTTADFNGDGWQDIASASNQSDTITWYQNINGLSTSLDGNPTFTENGSPVVLDTDVEIFDPNLSARNGESDDFGGTTLTIQRSGGANSNDVFSPGGALSFGATALFLDSIKVGTFSNSAGQIALTFDTGVTNNKVNQIMRSLQYSNASELPPASVDLVWTFNDNNNGSQGSGGPLQVSGITTVDIIAVNDAPVATDDLFNTDEDVVLTGSVLGNDSDIEGDALSVNTTPVIDPANGSVQLDSDGTFIYTPGANFIGADSFTYEVNDGNGGTNTATANITVNSVNDAPIATDDTFNTDEDVMLTGSVLGNDSDIDGDAFSVNTTPVIDPANGSVQLNTDGTFTYTPDANFFGSDTFTYEVSDGNGGTDQAIVNITVDSVNGVPDATDDSFGTDEDVVLTGNVLGNDSDTDGDSLSVNTTPVIDPANGSVQLNSDGTFIYTPGANFAGSDSFIYAVADGNGGQDLATVSININSINDAPIAADDTFNTQEDVALTGSVFGLSLIHISEPTRPY